MFLSYSQRDPKWADTKMGSSNLTIGRYGCTTTSIADLSTYFGDNLTPYQVSQTISYIQGLVIWTTCKFTKFHFLNRERLRSDINIKAALDDPNRAVILNVANGSHWVVATGWDNINKVFKIADPWIGDRSDMRRYNNNITGAAYFGR